MTTQPYLLEQYAPKFTVYGFHTGKKLWFKTADGEEHIGLYHGWGIFGIDGKDYTDVIEWLPSESDDIPFERRVIPTDSSISRGDFLDVSLETMKREFNSIITRLGIKDFKITMAPGEHTINDILDDVNTALRSYEEGNTSAIVLNDSSWNSTDEI